jgi:hypothetical protein
MIICLFFVATTGVFAQQSGGELKIKKEPPMQLAQQEPKEEGPSLNETPEWIKGKLDIHYVYKYSFSNITEYTNVFEFDGCDITHTKIREARVERQNSATFYDTSINVYKFNLRDLRSTLEVEKIRDSGFEDDIWQVEVYAKA